MSFPAHIGYHVSSSGGFVSAWKRAQSLGCTAFQVFSSPPRNWHLPPLDYERVRRELDEVKAIGGGPLVLHAPYLVNLASSVSEIRTRSIKTVVYALELSDLAGGAPLVVHAGTAADGDLDAAFQRMHDSLKEVARKAPSGGRIVFELTSGAGVPLAALPEDAARLLDIGTVFRDPGICLDTQHLWAAGFDWHQKGAGRKLVNQLRASGCLQSLRCIHLNDSKSERGSRLDRHADIGEGFIGIAPLVDFIKLPEIARLPVILETPGSDWLTSSEFKRLKRAAESEAKSPSAKSRRLKACASDAT